MAKNGYLSDRKPGGYQYPEDYQVREADLRDKDGRAAVARRTAGPNPGGPGQRHPHLQRQQEGSLMTTEIDYQGQRRGRYDVSHDHATGRQYRGRHRVPDPLKVARQILRDWVLGSEPR